MESIPSPYIVNVRPSEQYNESNKKRYSRLVSDNEIYANGDDV